MFRSGPIFRQLDTHPMAHCATLTELPDGTLMAAWFAGAFETAPNQVIMAAWWSPHTGMWTAPRIIAAAPNRGVGQPVLFAHPKGEIWLFFVVIMEADWRSSQPFLQRSADNGRTWSEPVHLMDYPGLMFRSKPLLLNDRLVVPVYDENRWVSFMMISDDMGQTWRLTEEIETPTGNIHPTVVPMEGDRLLAYLRPGGKGGRIWRTESLDGGETWEAPTPTAFPNPNSGFDLIRLRSGRLALAYNPSTRMRTPLAVALALEDETHWVQRLLETEVAEFSYPVLWQHTGGEIHLVYTYRRQHIHHARFTEAWLAQGQPIHSEQAIDARTT